MITQEIKKISSEISNKIISIRREIHKFPELGFKEFKTSALISTHLKKLGFEVTEHIAGTGLSALLKGSGAGKTIAIRADMDALPIDELNTFDFVSQNKGVMHACGHDAHIATVLGAAEILSRLKDRIKGNVKFIFQPGEEGLGGAKYMIDEGVLENPKVDAIIATHVAPWLKTGSISVRPGPIMASPSEFEIVIKGKSGHAATPQNTIDPILIGSNLINLLQTLISREKNPLEGSVLSVTYFNAGSSYNIIPDTATIRGTVRTFDMSASGHMAERMEDITASLTKAMKADYKFNYKISFPPVVNDAEIVRLVTASAARVICPGNVITNPEPTMLAEDFAYFVEKVPGALFNLGCGNPDKGIVNSLHNSRFDVDEACIQNGMEIMAQCAIDYLNS